MAGKLTKNLGRIVTVVVIVAIVAVGSYFVFSGGGTKTVKARFTAAVGVYNGTPVRQLGVDVGKVTSVEPKGSYVEVGMEYEDKYSLPANASAVEVANSLVSDRFIQLSAYPGSGEKLGSGATIPLSRTGAPAEIDDIYSALNKLSVALGPNGANSNGALSTLLKVGAANLKGNGAPLGQSIENLSRAAKTLADGRQDLFGTVTNLRKFTGALQESDSQVRRFNTLLAAVSNNLAGERDDLGVALKQLGLALQDVNAFVKKNASKLHTDVVGLRRVTDTLVRQKASLNETLSLAPVALANIVHSYQPNLGVLATRSNLGSLFDPAQVCVVIKAVGDKLKTTVGGIGQVFGSVTDLIVNGCDQFVKQFPNVLSLLDDAGVTALVNGILGGIQKLGTPMAGG